MSGGELVYRSAFEFAGPRAPKINLDSLYNARGKAEQSSPAEGRVCPVEPRRGTAEVIFEDA